MEKIIALIFITVFCSVIEATHKRGRDDETGQYQRNQRQRTPVLIKLTILLDANKDGQVSPSDVSRLDGTEVWHLIKDEDKETLEQFVGRTGSKTRTNDFLDEYIINQIDLLEVNQGMKMNNKRLREIFGISEVQAGKLLAGERYISPEDLKTAFTNKKFD